MNKDFYFVLSCGKKEGRKCAKFKVNNYKTVSIKVNAFSIHYTNHVTQK